MNQVVRQNKPYTLIFLTDNTRVLLGQKKRGFAEGKWNGFGGKVEKEESVFEGAIREMEEECGVKIKEQDLKFQGFMTFDLEQDQIHRIHIFTAQKYEGEIIETEEMKPQWYEIKDIPYKQMWKDDEYWYPIMFQNKFFNCYFKFSDSDTIETYNIEEFKSYEELLQLQLRDGYHKLQ